MCYNIGQGNVNIVEGFRAFGSGFNQTPHEPINTLGAYTFETPFDGGKRKSRIVHLFSLDSSESFSIKEKRKGGERKD